jgi:hypothetical protein
MLSPSNVFGRPSGDVVTVVNDTNADPRKQSSAAA